MNEWLDAKPERRGELRFSPISGAPDATGKDCHGDAVRWLTGA